MCDRRSKQLHPNTSPDVSNLRTQEAFSLRRVASWKLFVFKPRGVEAVFPLFFPSSLVVGGAKLCTLLGVFWYWTSGIVCRSGPVLLSGLWFLVWTVDRVVALLTGWVYWSSESSGLCVVCVCCVCTCSVQVRGLAVLLRGWTTGVLTFSGRTRRAIGLELAETNDVLSRYALDDVNFSLRT